MPPAPQDISADSSAGPSAFWLAFGILLAGIGTLLLGPILPDLARNWHLTDEQGGLLLAAKFTGSFFGGILVPRRLRMGILRGALVSCLAFSAFAYANGLALGALTLFIAGFGIGQIIASTNILAGRRYTAHTGSALSSLNLFFSLGAVTCGVLVAALVPRFGLRNPVLSFAGLFLATALGGLLRTWHNPAPSLTPEPTTHALLKPILLHYSLMLFFYGGLETCLAAWLTTFELRFSSVHLLAGQSALVVLLIALTAGRALASAAMRVLSESTMQRTSLALSALLIAALAISHGGASLTVICILLGLALAPIFPSTFALLIRHAPSAREAGFILAVSGLGAALFPWLMGVVSTHSGSLRIAMAIPFLLAATLLTLTLLPRRSFTAHPAA